MEDASADSSSRVNGLLSSPEMRDLIARSVSRNRSSPNVNVFEHVRSKKKLLYDWLGTKRKIYLDTCHWINILNSLEGAPKSIPIYSQIAALLEELHDIIVCPASLPLVTEILKQNDPVTLRQSASLIDRLSYGICLQNPARIMELEFINSFERLLFGDDISMDAYAYWTKIPFVAGELLPKPNTEHLDPIATNLIQKTYFDVQWEVSFVDCVNILRRFGPWEDPFPGEAWKRNENSRGANRISFEEARTEEMAYMLSQVIPRLKDAFDYIKERFKRSGMHKEDVPMPQHDPAFAPSVQILGNLFAVMRSSGRVYAQNDYVDFEHGSLAVPYCEAFFCDKRFFHILTEKPLELHRVYNVKIAYKPDDILAHLENLKVQSAR